MKNILFFLCFLTYTLFAQSSKGKLLANKQDTKVLDVPYLSQPTSITCQSASMKMVAMYMKKWYQTSFPNQSTASPAADKSILKIWDEVNTGKIRPSQGRNDWTNFIWWLNNNIPNTKFKLKTISDETVAIPLIIKSIDSGYPVMLSTNHTRVQGHIILIVGYKSYTPNQSSPNFRLICHDPYGAFHSELASKLYGKNRYNMGSSNLDGSEEGPGKGVELSPESIKRNRSELHNSGKFVLMTAIE